MKFSKRLRKILAVATLFVLVTAAGGVAAPAPAGKARLFSLAEAVNLALEQNPDLALAELEVEDARIRLDQAKDTAHGIPSRAVNNMNLARVKELIPRQTLMSLRLAEKGVETARENLRLGVQQAYFGLQLARELEEVRRRGVTLADDQLKQARVAYRAGVRARTDVLAAEAQAASARADLATAEKARVVAEMELNRLLGLPLTESLILATPLDGGDTPVETADVDEAVARARGRSAEVLKADEGLAVARLEFKLTDRYFAAADDSYRLAEAALAKAEKNLEKAGTGSELEVRKALLDIDEARQVLEQRRLAVTLLEENLRLADLRYRAGVGTNSEVLDVQVRLGAARTALSNATHSLKMAVLRYNNLVGTGEK